MEMEKFCSGVVVLDRMVSSVMQAVVLQTALVAEKSLVRLLVAMGSSDSTTVLLREPFTDGRFPISELHKVKRPDLPENKDGSETEDDDDEDEDANDQDDDAGDDDFSGEEGNDDEEDGEDDVEANGDGGSDDDDEDEDDDDDDDDDDGEDDDEEDEDEDEDEELPQPPSKKRK